MQYFEAHFPPGKSSSIIQSPTVGRFSSLHLHIGIWADGWLAKMGALDFAGGIVIHTSAGVGKENNFQTFLFE